MNENFVKLIRCAIQALYDDMSDVYCLDFEGGFENLDRLVAYSAGERRFDWPDYSNADACFQAWLERVSK